MKRLLLLTLLLGILSGEILTAQTDRAQIQEWYEQGNQFLAQGLYASARREYQKDRKSVV